MLKNVKVMLFYGTQMLGVLVVGDLERVGIEDLYTMLASLIAVWGRGLRVNVVIGKEIPIDSIDTNFKFDNVLYKLKKLPIDIKTLIRNEIPKVIVEDSTDMKRLQRRCNELEKLSNYSIDRYYMHVRYLLNGNTIIKLTQDEQDLDWYTLEVKL
jgi:hypothetical protein